MCTILAYDCLMTEDHFKFAKAKASPQLKSHLKAVVSILTFVEPAVIPWDNSLNKRLEMTVGSISVALLRPYLP